MRTSRVASQALTLATPSTSNPYICRACLQSARQLHTTPSLSASSEPFYKRIQSTLFGTKESAAAEKARESAKQKQLEEIKASADSGDGKKKKTVALRNGEVYEVAEVVDPSTHQDYVVSRNWKGMERVGSEEWVKKRADGGERYVGFMPETQASLSREEWEVFLRNVAAEVLALRKAGRDVLQVCNQRVGPAGVEGGEVKKRGEEAMVAGIAETSSQQEAQTSEVLEMELAQALASGAGGKISMTTKLDDPRVKFAILKRTMQLTAKRIPDILLSNATTLAGLHHAFATKEAPKKLHETQQLQMMSEHASNIQVHESRRTHVHKDKAVGRWKLIEEEMGARGMATRRGSIGREA